ncbi:2304_t:CDS:2, partial [Diversispora eburnea]
KFHRITFLGNPKLRRDRPNPCDLSQNNRRKSRWSTPPQPSNPM